MTRRFDAVKKDNTGRKPSNWISRLLDRWEQRLFVVDDAAALARGWEVRRLPGRRGREYRDPRWNLISACAACEGNGETVGRSCNACNGVGVLRADRAVAHEPPGGDGADDTSGQAGADEVSGRRRDPAGAS